jgi:hyperosmotically inducible periplasmic protein
MINLKTVIPVFGLVLLTMAGCQQQAKTSSEAPDSTAANQVDTPSTEAAKSSQDDAGSKVRKDQLNSDIRAKEQRNNTVNKGQAMNRNDGDVASEVRSKLEANLPASALTVSVKGNAVAVTGTVPTQAQYDRIDGLAKEIKGVTIVTTKVSVVPAKPK